MNLQFRGKNGEAEDDFLGKNIVRNEASERRTKGKTEGRT